MNSSDIMKFWEIVQVFHRYTTLQKIFLISAIPIILYVLYLLTIGRPPLNSFRLHFAMLSSNVIRELKEGGKSFEIDFSLINISDPPEEIHNIFGNLWVSGEYFVASTIQPARGHRGSSRVEWDLQIPVFPKESAFIPPKSVFKLPPPNAEILIGAQIVSKETEKQQYVWRIVNENGIPKVTVIEKPVKIKYN